MANKHASSLFTAAGNPKATQVGGIPASAVSGVGTSMTVLAASANVPSMNILAGSTTAAGPRAYEVALVAYDPDTGIVDVRLPKGIDAQVDLNDPSLKPTTFDIGLGDGKLAAKVEIRVVPARKPPKFTSVEEAEAWMAENA